MKKSFYEILEVSTTASQETIDAVYRVLQEKYSSRDSEQYPDTADRLKFLRIAYGVISDPAKRAVYDKRLATTSPGPVPAAPAAPAAPAPAAESPAAALLRPTTVEAAAPATEDASLLVTPVDLIAQIKEANRNTSTREDIAERLTEFATKPLVAAIVGLVFVGAVTYKSMQPAKPPSAAAQARQGPFVPDALAAAALDAAQKLGSRVETDIGYKDYSAAVADLATRIKSYLASAGAAKNPRLAVALEKLLDAHVKARDIWAIKTEHPEVFSSVDPDNSHYRKVLAIYPPAAQIAKPLDERGPNLRLDIDAVLNALWQEGKRAFGDARRLNSGTT